MASPQENVVNAHFVAPHPIVIARPASAGAPPKRTARAALPSTHRVEAGCALSLGRQAGELTVIEGRVWLTCRNDLCDHFLDPGDRVFLPEGHFAVVAPFEKGAHLLLRWRPDAERVSSV